MKKRFSIVIAAFISVIVVAGGFTIWYMYIMSKETKIMVPIETAEIVDGIYTVKTLYVNLFIIKSNGEYIVIDAGTGKKAVEEGLKTLGIDSKLIKAVFLTHTDYDHVAGLGAFPNAEIYISEDEEEMVNGKRHRAFIINNSLKYKHKLLKDWEITSIAGLKIEGILTKGHTPGSMSYLINSKYLFTGDTLSLKNGKADVFNKFFNMDTEMERKSIKKLKELKNIKYIFTAHYGYTDKVDEAFGGFGK